MSNKEDDKEVVGVQRVITHRYWKEKGIEGACDEESESVEQKAIKVFKHCFSNINLI